MSGETCEFDDPEESFRRGYSHGAWDVIEAVASWVTTPHREALLAWFRQVRQWRLKGYGKGRPDSNGTVAWHEMVPPRHKLRLR